MSSYEHRTIRLILRAPQDARDIAEYAAGYGWMLEPEVTEENKREARQELLWSLAPGVLMHYLVDDATNLPYIYFTAPMRNISMAFLRHAEQNLDTIHYNELLAKYDASRDSGDRARALLELALGSPRELDERSFSRITSALIDDNSDVRKAAVHSTAYTPSRRYRPYLRRIAMSDPDDIVKMDAVNMLGAYDDALIGDE